MTLRDTRGLALTGVTAAAIASYEAAVAELQCYRRTAAAIGAREARAPP